MAMLLYKAIVIEQEEDFFSTNGLKGNLDLEIKIFNKGTDYEAYFEVLKYVIDYVFESNPIIRNQETIAYNSWVLQFVKTAGYFSLWEANPDGNGFCSGVEYAIKVTKEQKMECEKHNVQPHFPTFSQNIVISKGVYEGLTVDAVRYPSPAHMCGWWITTDLYDENIESLMNVHFYHVAFKRPDILRFLALPDGFRFYTQNDDVEVWYDKNALIDN